MGARPVIVVQHEPSVPPGSITDVLERSKVEHYVLEAWRAPAWPSAGELSALVVMGGTMNVDELDAYPFLRQSRTLMAEALERDIPVMGVCLGAQMMARVLGGDVHRATPRNARFSPLELSSEAAADPVMAPFATGAEVLQFHEDTFTIPTGAVPLATSAASGLHQAFRHGERAYAIQFHFEVDTAILKEWCRNIGQAALLGDWGISEDDLMTQAARHIDAQHRAGTELFAKFLATEAPARAPAAR
jgi:GMP synthase (glutamine-hydrolysing)